MELEQKSSVKIQIPSDCKKVSAKECQNSDGRTPEISNEPVNVVIVGRDRNDPCPARPSAKP
jgi:hypothetical protein